MSRYPITPVAKPRMTRGDKFRSRPATRKYWIFKRDIRALGVDLPPAGAVIIFILPMPKTWSKAKRQEMCGQPHQQTPDLDNLIKALGDAVYEDDSHIHQLSASKIWGEQGEIIIIKPGGEHENQS